MTLDLIKDIVLILASIGTLLAVGKGVLEYAKNNRVKRAEYFSGMQQEMHKILSETQLDQLLDSHSTHIREVNQHDRLRFLGFYEKVALMLNSGLLNENVAYYIFGYYAIQCYENQYFWEDVNKNSPFWSLFIKFAGRMKLVQTSGRVGTLIDTNKLQF